MVRQTSREALKDLISTGKRETARAKVLKVIVNAQGSPLSRRQISLIAGLEINSGVARINELLEDEVIQEGSRIHCPISERSVISIIWKTEDDYQQMSFL